MPWFDYRALTPGGAVITGQLEADTRESAMTALTGMRLELRDLTAGQRPPRSVSAVSAEDLAFFNEQLASMADAGIALDEGLAQLARDVESPRLRTWIEAIVADLRNGTPLEQAVAAHESHLPLLYSRVIRAGVRTGDLATTLLNLNEHLRLAGRTRRMMWELLAYPLLVMALALCVVGLFLTFVVPKFAEIFVDFDTTLPAATQFIIHLGMVFPSLLLWLGIATLVAVIAWRGMRFSSGGRALRESAVDLIPFVGRVHRASVLARFLRAVATAVGNGIDLPEAMRLGAGATGSALLTRDADRLAQSVESGDSALRAADSGKIIPPLFGLCVQSARSRDALPVALAKLANAYEQRAEHTQAMLRVVLVPTVIILLGCFLGFTIFAIFLPLIHLVNSMTG